MEVGNIFHPRYADVAIGVHSILLGFQPRSVCRRLEAAELLFLVVREAATLVLPCALLAALFRVRLACTVSILVTAQLQMGHELRGDALQIRWG